jgi:multiple sugar transport system ATP-binding protein
LLGPSGCGKTTTLRVISGLEKPQNGTIHMDEKEIVNAKEAYFASPSERKLNLVFQSYALWPHMTVRQNIAFGLNLKKLPKQEVEKLVQDSLRRMQIDQFIDRYPSELSGGQQQRVAIARAIASEPSLLLLDEPLSNLDAKLRVDMRSELKRLHTETGTTMIYVTHDQVEALTMSTKIAIFKEGEIIQVAPPLELYNNPSNLYVADFIGNPRINFVEGHGTVDSAGLHVVSAMGELVFPCSDFTENMPQKEEFEVVLGIRPEQISIHKTGSSPSDIKGRIYTSMPAGSESLITTHIGENALVIKALGITYYEPDEEVYLSIDPKKINVFDKTSEQLIKYSV